jgi:hypothetical protein
MKKLEMLLWGFVLLVVLTFATIVCICSGYSWWIPSLVVLIGAAAFYVAKIVFSLWSI